MKAVFLCSAAVLLACSAGLCFVPLCHLLAFEFALVMTLPASFVGAAVGMKASDLSPDRVGQAMVRALLWGLMLSPWALIPITLNMFRVKNCNYTDGLMFYFLVTEVSLLVAAWVGVALGHLVQRRRWLWFTGFFLGSLIPPLWRLWYEPPVDAFSLFVAYFPGPIYDEVISVGDRVLASRVEDILFAVMLCALSACKGPSKRRWLWAALSVAGMVGCRVMTNKLQVHRSAEQIADALGRTESTDHFVVHGPAEWDQQKWERLLVDLEFAYGEDLAFFMEAPKKPIEVFFYKDAVQKKRLLGAGRTQISKPWQGAMHLHQPQVGNSITIHELAHAFSVVWSRGPIYLPRNLFVLPIMGLVEGVAEGAEWSHGRLDLHQWSSAMQQAKPLPSISTLMSGVGFYLKNASVSYTRCGSFVNFIRYNEGLDTIKTLYEEGADGMARLPEWEAKWNALLSEQVLSAEALEHARMRYDRPSVFHKVCAHEIAALRSRRGTSKLEKAYQINESILHFIPGDLDARMFRIRYLHQLDRTDEALKEAIALGHDPKAGAVWRRKGRLYEGDLRSLQGDYAGALEAYNSLELGAFERDEARNLHVRKAALRRIEEGEQVGVMMLELLTNPKLTQNQDDYLALTDTFVMQAPYDPLAWYLRGRCHQNRREMEMAVQNYEISLDLGLDDEALRYESLYRIAAYAFDQGRFAEASAMYGEMAQRDDLMLERGERFELERWSRRAAFFGERLSGGGEER